MGSGAATAYPSNMIPPHTKAISKQNTLFRVPQHGRGCFALGKKTFFKCRRFALASLVEIVLYLQFGKACGLCRTAFSAKVVAGQNKIPVNPWFRVDPVFLRRYNKNEYENLEVNAGKWTRIIVEVEPPARWIRKQKQLRSRLRQQ